MGFVECVGGVVVDVGGFDARLVVIDIDGFDGMVECAAERVVRVLGWGWLNVYSKWLDLKLMWMARVCLLSQ